MHNIQDWKCKGALCHLTAWHVPGGLVDLPARWTAMSDVEVEQSTSAYPANIRTVESGRREGSEGQIHKEEESEGGSKMGTRDPMLNREGSI